MYIRFGTPPTSGRSVNSAAGTIEAGVSVYRATWRNGRILVETPADGEWALDDLRDRIRRARTGIEAVYLVTGEAIGTGHDGEPLLAGVATVGVVNPATLETEN